MDEERENGDRESEDWDEESEDGHEKSHDEDCKYDDSESEESSKAGEMGFDWLGKIMWESKENPFSAPGDSGALVYALEKGVVIPLGVHLGSPSSWPFYSVCLSIESFSADGEKAGYGRLRFAEAESRTVGGQAPNVSDEEEELTEGQLEEKAASGERADGGLYSGQ